MGHVMKSSQSFSEDTRVTWQTREFLSRSGRDAIFDNTVSAPLANQSKDITPLQSISPLLIHNTKQSDMAPELTGSIHYGVKPQLFFLLQFFSTQKRWCILFPANKLFLYWNRPYIYTEATTTMRCPLSAALSRRSGETRAKCSWAKSHGGKMWRT